MLFYIFYNVLNIYIIRTRFIAEVDIVKFTRSIKNPHLSYLKYNLQLYRTKIDKTSCKNITSINIVTLHNMYKVNFSIFRVHKEETHQIIL